MAMRSRTGTSMPSMLPIGTGSRSSRCMTGCCAGARRLRPRVQGRDLVLHRFAHEVDLADLNALGAEQIIGRRDVEEDLGLAKCTRCSRAPKVSSPRRVLTCTSRSGSPPSGRRTRWRKTRGFRNACWALAMSASGSMLISGGATFGKAGDRERGMKAGLADLLGQGQHVRAQTGGP